MRILLYLLFLLSATIPTKAQQDARLIGLEKDVEYLMSRYEAVGLSLTIVEGDSILFSAGFGFRDREQQLPMNAETLLPIGSLSKSFTGLLLGILEENKVIELNDKPALHLPGLAFFNDDMNQLITIEDLLCHKSGLGGLDGSNTFFPTKKKTDFVPRFRHLKPNGEIKNSFIYCNVGFGLAGLIAEQAGGEAYGEQIKKKIFQPLAMHRSVTDIQSMKSDDNHALAYGLSDGKQVELLNRVFSFSQAAGALICSTKELGNYLIAWLNNGKFNGRQVIPAAYLFEATTLKNIRPQNQMDEKFYLFGYGYGWFLQSMKGHYAVEHGGNVPGYSTQLAMYPHKKIGIAVITNQNNSALPYLVEDIISNRMLGLEQSPLEDYPVGISEIWNNLRPIKAINQNEAPSQNLKSYCGKYLHKGYGEIEIVQKDTQLHIRFPEHDFVLEHQNHNNFMMVNTKQIPEVFGLPFFNISFQVNENNDIESLRIDGFQSEGVNFVRR